MKKRKYSKKNLTITVSADLKTKIYNDEMKRILDIKMPLVKVQREQTLDYLDCILTDVAKQKAKSSYRTNHFIYSK